MQTSLTSVALCFALATIFLTWTWKLLNWVWFRPKKLEKLLRQQGLQGNSYRLLIGDLKDAFGMLKQAQSKPIDLSADIVPRLAPFLDQSVKKYGKNLFTWFGPTTPTVHIMEPELIREVLTKIGDFQKPATNSFTKYLVTGLFSYDGQQWSMHRRIINPAFHSQKLRNMVPAFYQSCSEMIGKWKRLASVEGSIELDVWPSLQNLTGDAISRTAFGSSYEEGKRLFLLLQELAAVTIEAVQNYYIPGWKFVPTKTNRRLKEIDREVQSLLMDVISKREKVLLNGEAASDDLLGLLLESNSREIREHGNDKKFGLSIREVIDECKLFYFAGQETTSVLLVWTLIMLSTHQEWQERARQEVLRALGERKPDYDDLSNLKVITMIFYEVLRLYPPVVALNRRTAKDVKLGKYMLPAGIHVAISTILVHHDRDLWGEDAKEFKPERFAEGVSKAIKNDPTFLAFGFGPRICIGMNFGLMEAKMALAMILQSFTFKLSPSYTHAPFTIITVQPQHGAHLILHER